MKKKSRGIVLLGIFLIFVALLVFTTPGKSSAFDAGEYAAWKSFHDAETIAAIQQLNEFSPPSPNQDPCLHCHIAGQEIGEWTPLYRWISFGAVGLIFLFGMGEHDTEAGDLDISSFRFPTPVNSGGGELGTARTTRIDASRAKARIVSSLDCNFNNAVWYMLGWGCTFRSPVQHLEPHLMGAWFWGRAYESSTNGHSAPNSS